MERGRDWAFTPANRDEPDKLAFGRWDTDDVDVLLWRQMRGRQIRVQPVEPDEEPVGEVVLKSGAALARPTLVPAPEALAIGELSYDDPVMQRFSATGRLSMRVDRGPWRIVDAASDKGRRQVQAFFSACRGPPGPRSAPP